MMPKEQEFMRRFTEIILDYLQDNPLDENALSVYQDYSSLESSFDASIGENGISEDELLTVVQTYLDNSVRTFHPQFFGKSYAGYNTPALMGEMLSNVTNTSMATYIASPAATLIENQMIKKMGCLAGFENGDGIFVPGGTQANLIAMLCARNAKDPNIKREGLKSGQKLVIFISDQAHYSFISAANVLGIGMNNVVRVQTDEMGRMDPEALKKAIRKSAGQGDVPFFIGATAGSTVLGAFDPIEEIAEIAVENNLWLHIDGALGGSVLLSDQYKHLIAGSELADSFTWDAHKMMGIPLPCSVILTRDKGILYPACTTCDVTSASSYVFHDSEEESFDLGKKSLQCTRKVDALKLWMAWKYYGDVGYEKRIDQAFQLAQHAERKIEASPSLEMVFPRQFINICFRYVPENNENATQFNKALRERLVKNGKIYINYSEVKGTGGLRINLINPEVCEKDIDFLFEHVVEQALRQEKAMIEG